jgi:hypothetical protein
VLLLTAPVALLDIALERKEKRRKTQVIRQGEMSSARVKLCLCLPGRHAAGLWNFRETPPARHHAIPAPRHVRPGPRRRPQERLPCCWPRTCSPAPHQRRCSARSRLALRRPEEGRPRDQTRRRRRPAVSDDAVCAAMDGMAWRRNRIPSSGSMNLLLLSMAPTISQLVGGPSEAGA